MDEDSTISRRNPQNSMPVCLVSGTVNWHTSVVILTVQSSVELCNY